MKKTKQTSKKKATLSQKRTDLSHENIILQSTTFDFHKGDENLKFRKSFIFSVLFTFIITILIGFHAGINGDEYFQNSYSDNITGFYKTFGKDTSCFYHPNAPIKYYGGLFELISGGINQSLDLDYNDSGYHHTRHLLIIIFGFVCIIFLGLWLRLTGGWLLATLGVWIIFLSPRFLGHITINPKDIPFAAGYLISLFYLTVLIRTYPKLNWKSLSGLSIGIGISIGMRIGGLILFGIVGLFLALKILNHFKVGKHLKDKPNLRSVIGKISASLILGLTIGLLFWPYGLINPIAHIPEALKGFTELVANIKVLFNGKDYFGNQLPWYYHILWIFYTIPLSVLLGLLLLVLFNKIWYKKTGMMDLLIAVSAIVIPVAYIIIQESTLHDGWRHIIFVYPPLVFLATIGWFIVMKNYWHKRNLKILFMSLLFISMLEPAVFVFRNFTHPYVYFNPIAGGIHGARGNFELDYWGISAGESADWMIQEGIVKKNDIKPLTIATNFEYPVRIKFSDYSNVKVEYIRYRERHFKTWDYGIFVSRFIPGIQLREGIWPSSSETIHRIKANGVDLAAILYNKDDEVYRADQLVQKGLYMQAISLLLIEVKKHPENEFIWIDLGYSYQNINDYKLAEEYLKKALLINPHSIYANNYLAFNYMMEGRFDESIELFNKTLEINENNEIACLYLARLYNDRSEYDLALKNALRSIEIKPNNKEAYELVAQIYQNLGNQNEANRYLNFLQSIN